MPRRLFCCQKEVSTPHANLNLLSDPACHIGSIGSGMLKAYMEELDKLLVLMLFLYRHLGRLHTIEYHIIPMPPDAPKDQVDGHPHISTMHREAGACSPPADPLSVSSGLPIQLAPSLKSPHPHLVWLPHNLAEGVRSPTLGHKRGMPPGAGGHKPTTLQPVGSPTIVP
jgi:hypothetical protein